MLSIDRTGAVLAVLDIHKIGIGEHDADIQHFPKLRISIPQPSKPKKPLTQKDQTRWPETQHSQSLSPQTYLLLVLNMPL